MKKAYIKPKMKVLDCGSDTQLLAASCESNDFWKCPEPEEGCDNAWWCDKDN